MTMTREEAIYILKAIQALICPNKESVLENNFSEAFDMAIEALQDKPTGGWEFGKNHYRAHFYKCSNCGTHWDFEFNFCPNCGADMRGGAK